jgi:putative transposase
MYDWRQMTPAARAEVLHLRKQCGQPWHGPPHGLETHWFHIAAACYEHQPILGVSPARMAAFEKELLRTLAPLSEEVSAWCVLPNHYHVLLQCISLPAVRKALGALHGRTSHDWNVEDGARGRTCWHRCLPKPVKSESHRWATLNYIHHNPIHHHYARCWQEWPFSSAGQYLEAMGRAFAAKTWKAYPLLGYGKGWDEPEYRLQPEVLSGLQPAVSQDRERR